MLQLRKNKQQRWRNKDWSLFKLQKSWRSFGVWTIPYITIPDPDGSLNKNYQVKTIYSNIKGYSVNNKNISTCSLYLRRYSFFTKATYRLTFRQICDYIIGKLTKEECRVPVFVTDHYQKDSIKGIERKRQSNIEIIWVDVSWKKNSLQLKSFLQNSHKKNGFDNIFDGWLFNKQQTYLSAVMYTLIFFKWISRF